MDFILEFFFFNPYNGGTAAYTLPASTNGLQYNNKNLKHILINNGCHESVGGQPTAGFSIKAEQIAKACGYPHTCTCITEEELRQAIKRAGNKDGLEFIQVMVNAQSRSDLGRPTIPALKNKENFMNYIVRR